MSTLVRTTSDAPVSSVSNKYEVLGKEASVQAEPSTTSEALISRAEMAGPAPVATQAMLIVPPAGLKVELESPTDWPAILVPFVLGAAAFYFTSSGQRQQTRSNTAQFRNEWIQTLRTAAVAFATSAGQIATRRSHSNTYYKTPEYYAHLNDLIASQSTILLMLDTKEGPKREMRKAMADLLTVVSSGAVANFQSALTRFRRAGQTVLDEAWNDMKNDLGHADSIATRAWKWIKNKRNGT